MKVIDEEEIIDEKEEENPDIYNCPEVFVEADEIDNREAGFMKGYNDA